MKVFNGYRAEAPRRHRQAGEDKKWRGMLRLRIPKDDGSEQDEWSKCSFGGAMWAIEERGPGYHWGWDEAALKGKAVGVLFCNREWEMNGSAGWTTECCALNGAGNIRSGRFKMPRGKLLKNGAGSLAFAAVPISGDGLPF